MEHMHLVHRALFAAVALALASSPAEGQLRMESRDSATRQRCSTAMAAIGARVSSNSAPTLQNLHNCDESSGAALSRLWATARLGADELNQLVHASADVHDMRTANAAIAVVRDAGRTTPERAAALTVLASYLDSSWVGDVTTAQGRTDVQVVLRTHPAIIQGSHPITPSHRAAIASFVEQLRQTEPPGVVRDIAETISRSLRRGPGRRTSR